MTTQFDLSDEEAEDLLAALSMRCAYIETGSVAMRAADAINCGKREMIRQLTDEQAAVVRRMDELKVRLLTETSRQRMRMR